ncbi:acyltransferase family protein [Paenibacillus alkalitolerans]|uniref:acyltransferase family protein n=1 Tax=Paenibacillus alkalitolerans TaxID=2799335 RepID=UPI001F3F795C|nr:acyltransferase family protein [Paenibacillus alkalitolerans]
MEKKLSYEILLLRSLSCLSVAMVHAVLFTFWIHEQQIDSGILSKLLNSMRLFFNVGTPIFVFITIFLLAKNYSDDLPKNFLMKRLKYLIPPYISMGIIGSIYKVHEKELPFTFANLAVESLRNIFMADYNGYFILIIVQFILLFYFLHHKLKNLPLKITMSVCFLINFAYLAFFNFVPPMEFLGENVANYLWYTASIVPFIGWVFYFILGYYCGKYYEKFIQVLNNHQLLVCTAPVVITLAMIALKAMDIPQVNTSKAVTYLFLVPSVIFFIFFISNKMKSIPNIIATISDHSFGIYLTHSVLMRGFRELYSPYAANVNPLITLMVIYISCVSGAMLISYLLNKVPFGKYIVGIARANSKIVKQKKISPMSALPQQVMRP